MKLNKFKKGILLLVASFTFAAGVARADLVTGTRGHSYTGMTKLIGTDHLQMWFNRGWFLLDVFDDRGIEVMTGYYKRESAINAEDIAALSARNLPGFYASLDAWQPSTKDSSGGMTMVSKDWNYTLVNGLADFGGGTFLPYLGFANLDGIAYLANHPTLIQDAIAQFQTRFTNR